MPVGTVPGPRDPPGSCLVCCAPSCECPVRAHRTNQQQTAAAAATTGAAATRNQQQQTRKRHACWLRECHADASAAWLAGCMPSTAQRITAHSVRPRTAHRTLSRVIFGCVAVFHTYSSGASVCVTTTAGCCGSSRILLTCVQGEVRGLVTTAAAVGSASVSVSAAAAAGTLGACRVPDCCCCCCCCGLPLCVCVCVSAHLSWVHDGLHFIDVGAAPILCPGGHNLIRGHTRLLCAAGGASTAATGTETTVNNSQSAQQLVLCAHVNAVLLLVLWGAHMDAEACWLATRATAPAHLPA